MDSSGYSVGDRVHVSFCIGCQFSGKFQKLKQEIEAALPGVQVTGSNHPVGFLRTAGNYAVLGTQLGLGALTLAGDKIFESLGKPMPSFVNTLQVGDFSRVVPFVPCNSSLDACIPSPLSPPARLAAIQPHPPLQQSKMSFAMGIWYGGSMLRNYLASSGAFEVAYNGEIVHSKLSQGHFPDNRYLIHKIEAFRKQGQIIQ